MDHNHKAFLMESKVPARPRPTRPDNSARLTRRLLVLDDDKAVLRTIAQLGTKLGSEVRACSNLVEFEDLIGHYEPDVLLIDLMMPDVDGIEVIAKLGPCCEAAIYVMTGADMRTLEASCEVLRSLGVEISGFLQKPFSARELRQIINADSTKLPNTGRRTEPNHAAHVLSLDAFEQAAQNGKIEPHFQPIFFARTRQLKGFEALLRVSGQSANHFASEYLEHMASNEDLSASITSIVIDKSLSFLAHLGMPHDLSMSINIFGGQAVAAGFREHLLNSCTQHGIAPSQVILELSEAAVFKFDDEDLRKVTQLRLAGFGLSIDDLGTGNSSLGRLASLPFSELKIDKSFCMALPNSLSAEAVIEACLGIARKLGMTVTAEGVENCAVAAQLADMGCHALQGHYFGKAMAPDAAAAWVRECHPCGGK